ncbi:hypothetical protein [Pontibacter sp. G13]|uniref:hypothetical protein n=1 Tax=Pontibacter sp. G13 TaxID=3074898 RepID=UPI00288AB3F3|nr:hypothetical protein [Pontibacter sp. G13]WNJ19236.1 hypothetical protein RJD25_01990 [Pontibacter sp. G13]
MTIRHILSLAAGALMLPTAVMAQVTTDPEVVVPTQEILISIDVASIPVCGSCEESLKDIVDGGEDLYIWTWAPAEHAQGHPLANGTGSTPWKDSNEALKLTRVGESYVFTFTMTPTDFYEVDAATVYANDISFLVKPKDGGGYGDPDRKSDDLFIPVDPPVTGPQKVYSFPATASEDTLYQNADDVFTLFYDNTLEEKASMQDASELYVYARAILDDGSEIKVANLGQIANFPELGMDNVGEGLFRWSVIPSEVYDIPAGKKLVRLRLQMAKPFATSQNDAVDGEFNFYLLNE